MNPRPGPLVARLRRPAALLAVLGLAAAACGGATATPGGSSASPASSVSSSSSSSSSSGGAAQTIKVAVVSNPQMLDIKKLIPSFNKLHPNIHVKFDILPENQLRQQLQKDIATNGGQFDVAMISNYQTPLWQKNGWLVNLSKTFISKDASYDVKDLITPIRKSLSVNGSMYSVPFYGESSFLMYRKDLLKKAGITMPAHPTWAQVAQDAAKLNDPSKQIYGICLRGEPGWGENLAPMDTVVNTFGGEWFNQKWQPQLTSAAFTKATKFYVGLVRKYGEPGAASQGFTGLLTYYTQGHCAMWYDATSAAGDIQAANAKIFAKTGFAYAPTAKKPNSGWLYSWSFGIPKSSNHQQAAWTFMSWATSKQYIKLVGNKLGWAQVPPGTRKSTYQLPQYQKSAGAFAQLTLKSIENATPKHPTVNPVPYTGVQFVDIPQFVGFGTKVSQQISAAIAGKVSVAQALKTSQQYAVPVGKAQAGS